MRQNYFTTDSSKTRQNSVTQTIDDLTYPKLYIFLKIVSFTITVPTETNVKTLNFFMFHMSNVNHRFVDIIGLVFVMQEKVVQKTVLFVNLHILSFAKTFMNMVMTFNQVVINHVNAGTKILKHVVKPGISQSILTQTDR